MGDGLVPGGTVVTGESGTLTKSKKERPTAFPVDMHPDRFDGSFPVKTGLLGL
jgi:hypothetical protein